MKWFSKVWFCPSAQLQAWVAVLYVLWQSRAAVADLNLTAAVNTRCYQSSYLKWAFCEWWKAGKSLVKFSRNIQFLRMWNSQVKPHYILKQVLATSIFFSQTLRRSFGSWFPTPTLTFAVMAACTWKESGCRTAVIIPAWQVTLLGPATKPLLLMCMVRNSVLLLLCWGQSESAVLTNRSSH